MNKGIIKIIIIAFIVLIAAAAIFAYVVSRPVENIAEEETGGGTGTFPSGGESAGNFSSKRIQSSASNSASGGGAAQKSGAVLTHLTQNAVSGAAVSGTTTAYYIDKPTGHIYKIGLDGFGLAKISNTTILRTIDSYWSPKQDKVAVRYFEDPTAGSIKLTVKSFFADLAGLIKAGATGTTTPPLEGVILPPDVSEMAASPAEDRVFYLSESGGLTSGIVADFKNKNQKKIFELSFGEFNVSWPAKDTITLLTKPSYVADGYLYFLNQRTAELSRILGGIKGLTALVSPSADKIIYAQSAKSGVETFLYDLKKGSVSSFGIKTMPEKCAWGKKNKDIVYCAAPASFSGGKYPDDWYQGMESFDDFIWSKNLSTGETKMLNERFGVDVINVAVSENDNYLIFTNKKDGTLWSLKLK